MGEIPLPPKRWISLSAFFLNFKMVVLAIIETMPKHDDHDALFRFIKTVSQAQFIGLKTWIEALHKDSNQWAFFEYLYRADNYNEKEIRHHFTERFGKFPPKQLAKYKFNTFDWLITSMAKLGYASTSQIRLMLDSIQILYERGSYIRSGRLITEARKILLERELFSDYQATLLIEIEIYKKILFDQERIDKLEEVLSEYQRVSKIRNNLDEFIALRLKYWEPTRGKFLQFGIRDFEAVEELVQNDLVAVEGKADSARAQYLYHRFWRLYHTFHQDFLKQLGHLNETLALFEQNPWLIEEEKEEYFRCIKSIVAIHINNRDRVQSRKYLRLLGKFDMEDPLIRKILLDKLVPLKFYFYNQFRHKPSGVEAISLVNQYLPDLEAQLEAKDLILVYYWVLRFYFDSGNYKEAKPWINKILNAKRSEAKVVLRVYTQVIHLIILFEEKDYIFLEDIGATYSRVITKHKDSFQIAFAVVGFLRKSPRYIGTPKFMKNMDKLMKVINSLEKEDSEKIAFHYLDLKEWVEELTKQKNF